MTLMLHVRIDGDAVETTPDLLAKLVLDGKVDRDSAVRLPGGAAEQPLELVLGAPQQEALTGELHRRLQRVCATDSSAVDVQELCTRVERLCQWRWTNSPVTARLFWAAAWLQELVDRAKNALDFYDAFLLLPASESHLRLLALNNRGVLRIRLGRLDGVEDLARAALGTGMMEQGNDGTMGKGVPQAIPHSSIPSFGYSNEPSGLPTACFNLLNLVNVSFGTADLLRTVDEELAVFFSRLPEDTRASWLGEEEAGQKPRDPSSGVRPLSFTLRDPTYRRLNSLMTRLAAHARAWAQDVHRPGRGESPFRWLSLWDCRDRAESSACGSRLPVHGRPTPDLHHLRYAEAAALLLSDDIPCSLARPDHPLAQVEQSAREELAAIESHLAAGQYELALSRLQVQRRVLASFNGPGASNGNHDVWGPRKGLSVLLTYVDAQLERIADLQARQEQLELRKACAAFVAEVQEFCTLTDAGRAQAGLEDLVRRLEQFKTQAKSRANGETLTLLDELAARAGRHARELKRAWIEQQIEDARRHVRQQRPVEETVPVPESVYRALAQCRLHDPEGWIDDWTALQEQLDAHQGRYYLHQAWSALELRHVSWERVEDDLVRALTYDPAAWRTVASWLGWGRDRLGLPPVEGGLKEACGVNPLSALCPPKLPLDRAGRLLEKALGGIGADAERCTRLWQSVETALAPAVAGRDAEALAEARVLAQRCLDAWPAGLSEMPGRADPRHPVNRFLEACEKARGVMEAEQMLGARPPRLVEAKNRLTGILRAGLDRRDQFRRVVAGLYLAQFHEKDPPPVQRQVLAGLEAWVETVPQEALPQIQGGEIVREMERVRVGVKCEA